MTKKGENMQLGEFDLQILILGFISIFHTYCTYYSKNILKYLKFQSIYLLITNKFPIDFSIKLIEGILFCMDLQ